MKKKHLDEIPEFKAKRDLPRNQFPFDDKISIKEKRTGILKGNLIDLHREIFNKQFSPQEFFEERAPRSKELDRDRIQGSLLIRW